MRLSSLTQALNIRHAKERICMTSRFMPRKIRYLHKEVDTALSKILFHPRHLALEDGYLLILCIPYCSINCSISATCRCHTTQMGESLSEGLYFEAKTAYNPCSCRNNGSNTYMWSYVAASDDASLVWRILQVVSSLI